MSVDRYTKVMLTIIAACLVWISIGGPSLIAPVEAQTGDRVFIAGWIDSNDNAWKLPPAVGYPRTNPSPIPTSGR
jgi:hypothetical protein